MYSQALLLLLPLLLSSLLPLLCFDSALKACLVLLHSVALVAVVKRSFSSVFYF